MPVLQEKASGLELVRDLRLPPSGFNLRSASDRDLLAFGLPKRPDATKFPEQAALWDKVTARPLQFVRPNLTRLVDRAPSKIRDFVASKVPPSFADPSLIANRLHPTLIRLCLIFPQTSTNWSGAVVKRPAAEPLVTVSGQWTVPSVSPPASASNGHGGFNDGTYICAAWVGLDGWGGSGDVLQAGTNSVVTVSGGRVASTSYYAWIEWFGNPWQVESSFPVSPGDTIVCTVCAPFSNTHGAAFFTNQTTGMATSFGIDAPAGTSLVGNVAEWIVEDPGQLSGSLFPFPNYGQTTFQNCSAGSKSVSLNLSQACPINLVNGGGGVISEAILQSNTSLLCEHLG